MPSHARRRPITQALPAAAAALLTACTAQGDGDGQRGAWKPGQEWRLVEQARIGSMDGDGADVFASIVDVELDAMGRVWVADAQQHQVRVFDSAGAHVRSIGRKGGGPGEFGGIAGMDWAPDGTLWVLDGGNMRFAVYDTAGRLVTTRRRAANVVVSPWPLGFDRRGYLYDVGGATGGDGGERVVRFAPELQPRDTFRAPAFQVPTLQVVTQQGRNRSIHRVNVPFAPVQLVRLDPDGFAWVAATDRYRLTRYRFDGTVDRVVERPARPRPVTAADRAAILAQYRDFQERGGKMDESRFPKTHPVIFDFFIGDDGHLWVLPMRASGVADVFTPDGVHLGEVAFPRVLPSPVPSIRGDRMAAVEASRDGVPGVRIFRIERTPR